MNGPFGISGTRNLLMSQLHSLAAFDKVERAIPRQRTRIRNTRSLITSSSIGLSEPCFREDESPCKRYLRITEFCCAFDLEARRMQSAASAELCIPTRFPNLPFPNLSSAVKIDSG